MECHLYVLYSFKFSRFYIGISEVIKRSLREHNQGKIKSTKAYIPWKVVHLEYFPSKQEARIREKYLKSAAGRRWRRKNIIIDKGD